MSQVVVLFEVTPTQEGKARYLELAAQLKGMVATAPGFVRAERFESLNEAGKLLSMNVWESEETLAQWRNQMAHRMSQLEGREQLFSSYKIMVCSVLREYSNTDREEAPEDSNAYFKT